MIIGFTGKKRSGKSTASAYVLSRIEAERVNFKTALLNEMKDRFPNTLNALVRLIEVQNYDGTKPLTVDGMLEEKPDDVIRFFLQEYGTGVRRADDPDYWVDQWKNTALDLKDKSIVVDDIRFLNEARAVRELSGIIIRIEREGLETTDTHISETEMDGITADYTIRAQTGDIKALQYQLGRILEKHNSSLLWKTSSGIS